MGNNGYERNSLYCKIKCFNWEILKKSSIIRDKNLHTLRIDLKKFYHKLVKIIHNKPNYVTNLGKTKLNKNIQSKNNQLETA